MVNMHLKDSDSVFCFMDDIKWVWVSFSSFQNSSCAEDCHTLILALVVWALRLIIFSRKSWHWSQNKQTLPTAWGGLSSNLVGPVASPILTFEMQNLPPGAHFVEFLSDSDLQRLCLHMSFSDASFWATEKWLGDATGGRKDANFHFRKSCDFLHADWGAFWAFYKYLQ